MRVAKWMVLAILAGCGGGNDGEEHAGHGPASSEPLDPHAGHGGQHGEAGTAPVVTVRPDLAEALRIRSVEARVGTASTAGRAPAEVSYDPLATARIAVQSGGQVRALWLPRSGERLARGARVASIYDPSIQAAFEELRVARDLGDPWKTAARERLVALGVDGQEVDEALESGTVPASFSLYAAIGGVVVERSVSEGAWLGPGGTLGVVADPERVVADVTVLGDAPPIGHPVTLRDPGTGQQWSAQVASSLPTADAAGARLRLVPEGAVPVGRPIIAEWAGQPVEGVWVPRSAVVDTGSRRVVFVEADGGYSPRSVVLGARAGDEVQLVDGVSPGERVVVAGTFLLDSETQIGAMGHAGHGG
jgi:membrane fusion protein, copper/silver efflux system